MSRSGLSLALVLAACAAAGCAARPEGGRVRLLAAPAPVAAREARPGGSGWLRMPAVRVRDDTPSLADLHYAQWLEQQHDSGWAPAWGPAGEAGFTAPEGVLSDYAASGAGSTGSPVCGAPAPAAHATSPFAAPYVASGLFVGGDVLHHRPGLSVGNGIYGRDR